MQLAGLIDGARKVVRICARVRAGEKVAVVADTGAVSLAVAEALAAAALEVTPEAKQVIAEEGYDPAFGARPLKRTIQRLIQNPLALAVLEGRFADGDRVVVRPDGKGALAFEKSAA